MNGKVTTPSNWCPAWRSANSIWLACHSRITRTSGARATFPWSRWRSTSSVTPATFWFRFVRKTATFLALSKSCRCLQFCICRWRIRSTCRVYWSWSFRGYHFGFIARRQVIALAWASLPSWPCPQSGSLFAALVPTAVLNCWPHFFWFQIAWIHAPIYPRCVMRPHWTGFCWWVSSIALQRCWNLLAFIISRNWAAARCTHWPTTSGKTSRRPSSMPELCTLRRRPATRSCCTQPPRHLARPLANETRWSAPFTM